MASLAQKRDQLYERCAEQPAGTVFSQQDLVALGIAEDLADLVRIIQALTDAALFQSLTREGAPCFRLRTRDDARKFASLSSDAYLVYSTIEGFGAAGIWIKTLKARTNLHQSVITKVLKGLEGTRHVKQVKSVKYPGRKIYMLYGLDPGDESTGGPWYSDGELDVEFVEVVGNFVEEFVKGRSWRLGPKVPRRKGGGGLGSAAGQKELSVEFDVGDDRNLALSRTGRILTLYPPDYENYPTPSDILDEIDKTGILQGKDLAVQDLHHLLSSLVYANRLERVGRRKSRIQRAALLSTDEDGDVELHDAVDVDARQQSQGPEEEDMYRWVRKPHDEGPGGPGNGWTEAPCSRCPVFNLCEEGGPVDAKSCGYFEDWLSQ